MKTRIGGQRSIVGRVSSPATNRTLSGPAQKRIDQIVSRANDRHENALKVDGIDFLLWKKTTGGDFCTCHGNDQKDDSARAYEADHDEETSVPSIGDFTAGQSDVFKFKKLRDGKREREKLEKEANDQDFFEQDDSGQLTDIYSDEDEEFVSDEDEAALAEFADMTAPDEQARLQRTVTSLLLGGENTPCAICFGTGWTMGYQLFNGRRWALNILDVGSLGGFSVDKSKRPNAMTATSGSEGVVFNIDIPKYFVKACKIRLLNNLALAYGMTVDVMWPNLSTWETLTVAGINARKGVNNTNTMIRVSPSSNMPEEARVTFTHLEIVIEYSDRPKAQMPNMDSTETFELVESITQTNIEWPASVGSIEFGSIAVDSKYKRAWRITAVTIQQTAKNKVFAVETQAQKLQNMEPIMLLNLYRERTVILSNYRGLGSQ